MGPAQAPPTSDLPALTTRFLDLGRAPARWALKLGWRIAVQGADNLPDGPCILAANHVAVLDGPLVVTLTPRSLALAKIELFHGGVGQLLSMAGQIPVDRDRFDPRAIKRCVQVLQSGRRVVIFPESVRGAGDFTRFHGGAAYLAMVTGAPVVPVAVLGTRMPGGHVEALPPRGSRMDVVYGEPITVAAQPWPRRKAEVAQLSRVLQQQCQHHLAYAQQLTGMSFPAQVSSAAGVR